jgi:hypothetical protein
MRHSLFFVVMLQAWLPVASEADWTRPGMNTNQHIWGGRDRLHFAVPPGGFRDGAPRGVLRLGYPVLTNGAYDLINFIAIEPVVKGRKDFSELESSPDEIQLAIHAEPDSATMDYCILTPPWETWPAPACSVCATRR